MTVTARQELREFLRDCCLAARVLHKGPREPPLETNYGPLLCAEEPACGYAAAAGSDCPSVTIACRVLAFVERNVTGMSESWSVQVICD